VSHGANDRTNTTKYFPFLFINFFCIFIISKYFISFLIFLKNKKIKNININGGIRKKDKSEKQKYKGVRVICEVHEVNHVCTIKMGVQQVKYKKLTIKHE